MNYLHLRSRGLSRRQAFACCPTTQHWVRTIWQAIVWTFCIGVAIYWTSDAARAGVASELDHQRAYVHELEHALAQCLTEHGGAIKIGDEWHMCQVTPLGKGL